MEAAETDREHYNSDPHAMEDLQKIEKFVATLSYGKDLFPSTRSLLSYSFGKRSISEMFRSSMTNPDYADKCRKMSKIICSAAVDAITSSDLQSGLSKENDELESLLFFWEVYQIREVQNLLESEDVEALEDAINRISRLVHKSDVDKSVLSKLPASFLTHLNVEACNANLPLFRRDLTEQSSASEHEANISPVQAFIMRFEKELEKMRVGDTDMDSLKELGTLKLNENISSKDARQLSEKIVSVTLIAERSPELGQALFASLENFFYMLSDEAKAMLTKLMYDKHVSETDDLPSLGAFLQDYSSGITQCINQIGDHNEIQNDAAKFKITRDKLLWYLLMIPRETVSRLLIQSLEDKNIVPGVINTLRSCRAVSETAIVSENISGGRVPLVIDLVVSIFSNEAHRWTVTEQQDRLVYLLTALCRRRRTAKEKADGAAAEQVPTGTRDESVVDGGMLLKLFVLPNLMKRTQETLMLKLLHRFMQSVGTKEIHFNWTTGIGEKRPDAVQGPELVLLVVELFMEYESKRQQASYICRSILKCLGEKLKNDDVVFAKDTIEFVLFSLRQYYWWIRYAIVNWFSHTLEEPKQQIPTGLYKSLALEQQERCEQISVDFSFSPAECFFRSFFELAIFDVGLASDFLQKGISMHPRDENVVEKMALALVESLEQTHSRQPVASLAPLLLDLLRILDPAQEVRFVETLCESTFHGLRLIQHILLIATATQIAYYKNSDKALNNCPISANIITDTAHVASELLQAFCELSKAHAEKEVINLRRSRYPFPPEIKEDYLPPPQITIRRDERVYAQLSALFNVACSLTRIVAQPPLSLQVLINCLAELLLEVQKMRITPALDDLPPDNYKSNVVYAYAQPSHTKKQDGISSNKEADPSRANGAALDAKTCCVENELFNATTFRGKGSHAEVLATARQINGVHMRQNAEKRLTSKENPTSVVTPSTTSTEQRDGAGKSMKKKRGAKRR
ncbi:unnamed protein product [Cylicocyclus nassatus]|uniref:Edg1 TPR repeats region domain-containing protein n=1 Tax=Cylicocyclus nassatus TaxID=53992 RepID=A0AA36MDK8_CYLNA|nr:unnamed protein product [Cylicocyclus nassatus]